ncbi:alanyl-tRNA editing protein [Chloroflexia bacterium SDU3-3]|nr:alanyl-tRNA editing protein [Chloroflexia bacterium SDU3-3]
MQTERLYYSDPYIRSFSAQVVGRREQAGHHEVALDQTAFYPEGGGQPGDQGLLGGVAVIDTQAEDGVVWHRLAAPLAADAAVGEIDWARRFDHMQQHLGQHMLSAALEQLYDLRTVSFHLGVGLVTIDIEGQLSAEQAAGAEALVNEVIWEDRPVLARFVTAEELATIALRRPPKVSGPIRVVSVPDFDHSACGGTHPRSTGGVGVVHIRRAERRGELTRVEFLCGGRALRDYQAKDAVSAQLAGVFSVAPAELPDAVARLREAEERSRKALAQASERLLLAEAAELAAQAVERGGLRVVRRAFAGRTVDEVRALAGHLCAAGCLALLAAVGERAQLVFARPAQAAAPDCGALLRATVAQFGGRGGGQPAMAQGGIASAADADAALDAALAQL